MSSHVQTRACSVPGTSWCTDEGPSGIIGGSSRIQNIQMYYPKGLGREVSYILRDSSLHHHPSISPALPKQSRSQRKCAIPQARANPPAEIGRCQCGDFITQSGSITLGTTFCRCTPVYCPPQAPNIPAVNDCTFDTSCTNSGGGPCQKFKYEQDPQRDIPDWAGGVMPKYGVYTSFELFGP